MSKDASISFAWADGEHRFRLPLGQLRELQDKCDAGPPAIMARLNTDTWRVDDIRETIRLGLIGGGMSPSEAYRKVARYVDERPLMENVVPARLILMAALIGDPSETVGKPEAAEAETEAMDALPSPPSMEKEPS